MKYAGKKAAFMPKRKADKEDVADAKKPGDKKEDAKPFKKGSGLKGFLGSKMFGKKKLAKQTT